MFAYEAVGIATFVSVVIAMPYIGGYIAALVAFLVALLVVAKLVREVERRTLTSNLLMAASSAALVTLAFQAMMYQDLYDSSIVAGLSIDFSYWFVISLFLLLALPAFSVARSGVRAKIAGGMLVSTTISVAAFPFVAFASSFPKSGMPSVLSPIQPYVYLVSACGYKYYDAACFTLNPTFLVLDYLFWFVAVSLVCFGIYQISLHLRSHPNV